MLPVRSFLTTPIVVLAMLAAACGGGGGGEGAATGDDQNVTEVPRVLRSPAAGGSIVVHDNATVPLAVKGDSCFAEKVRVRVKGREGEEILLGEAEVSLHGDDSCLFDAEVPIGGWFPVGTDGVVHDGTVCVTLGPGGGVPEECTPVEVWSAPNASIEKVNGTFLWDQDKPLEISRSKPNVLAFEGLACPLPGTSLRIEYRTMVREEPDFVTIAESAWMDDVACSRKGFSARVDVSFDPPAGDGEAPRPVAVCVVAKGKDGKTADVVCDDLFLEMVPVP
jgi:hypothetical protein